jgi:hypothetical protein
MAGKGSQPSRRGDVRRLVLSLRPTILDLFAGYAIPGEEASVLLRDSVELLVRYCDSTEQPRHFFLQTLEDQCAAWVAAREAEESPDDGPPHA